MTKRLTEFMDPNPRALKRFVNAYRLQLHVANLMHLEDIDLGPGQLVAFAKWVLMRLQWPELAAEFDRDEDEFLKALEVQARQKPRRGRVANSEPAQPLQRWLSDHRVKALLQYGDDSTRVALLPVDSLLRTN